MTNAPVPCMHGSTHLAFGKNKCILRRHRSTIISSHRSVAGFSLRCATGPHVGAASSCSCRADSHRCRALARPRRRMASPLLHSQLAIACGCGYALLHHFTFTCHVFSPLSISFASRLQAPPLLLLPFPVLPKHFCPVVPYSRPGDARPIPPAAFITCTAHGALKKKATKTTSRTLQSPNDLKYPMLGHRHQCTTLCTI